MAQRPRWSLYFALLLVGFASAVSWCVRNAGAGGGSTHPILTVFAVLGSTIGLPFLVLGTTSPLMQVWWARLHGSGIPYRLFALSNLASLLALGLYPTLIEPRLTLEAQRIAWCCGFAVFAVITGVLAWKARTAMATPDHAECHSRGRGRNACAAGAEAALDPAANGGGDAVERGYQLSDSKYCSHSPAVDSAARGLSAHHHPCVRIPSPAAAQSSRTLSDPDAGGAGLRAFEAGCGVAAAHQHRFFSDRSICIVPLLP